MSTLAFLNLSTGSNVAPGNVIAAMENDAGASFAVSADTTTVQGSDGGNDFFTFTAGATAETFVAGMDTITGFQVGDRLNFDRIDGDAAVNAIAANASAFALTSHGDGEVFVFADGADGTGAEAITSNADVAAFLAGAFSGEQTYQFGGNTGWVIAVISDLLTDTAYVYDVKVGAGDTIGASSVVLVAVVNADAALTAANVII